MLKTDLYTSNTLSINPNIHQYITIIFIVIHEIGKLDTNNDKFSVTT